MCSSIVSIEDSSAIFCLIAVQKKKNIFWQFTVFSNENCLVIFFLLLLFIRCYVFLPPFNLNILFYRWNLKDSQSEEILFERWVAGYISWSFVPLFCSLYLAAILWVMWQLYCNGKHRLDDSFVPLRYHNTLRAFFSYFCFLSRPQNIAFFILCLANPIFITIFRA